MGLSSPPPMAVTPVKPGMIPGVQCSGSAGSAASPGPRTDPAQAGPREGGSRGAPCAHPKHQHPASCAGYTREGSVISQGRNVTNTGCVIARLYLECILLALGGWVVRVNLCEEKLRLKSSFTCLRCDGFHLSAFRAHSCASIL